MEFLKKHWQKIAAGLFVVLFLSTCVSNCSHKNEIRNMKNDYALNDSAMLMLSETILMQDDSIQRLNYEINVVKTENEMYKKQINDLNNALNRKVVVNIKQND